MSRSANDVYLSKEQELYFQKLHDLYEAEEYEKLYRISKQAWDQAYQIYTHTQEQQPFYIVLMVVQVHERAQTHLCQFMLVKKSKNTGERIKHSLVWFCDKAHRVFKLATDLCDLSNLKHWGDRTPPSPGLMMLE